MTMNLALVAKSTIGIDDFRASFPAPTGVAIPISLRLLFVGGDLIADWGDLRDVINRSFGEMIEIVTIGRIADLRTQGTKDIDIVFIQETGDRCRTKIRLEISQFCPIASTIYLTRCFQPTRHPDVIHVAHSLPIPFEQVVRAMLNAMRSQICCLKQSLGSSEPRVPPRSNLAEALRLLTPQQTKILVEVLKGIPNKLVARDMNIKVRTVKAHLTEIFRKTGTSQRAELIAKYSQFGAACDALPAERPVDPTLREVGEAAPPRVRCLTSGREDGSADVSRATSQFECARLVRDEGRSRPFGER